MIAIVNVTHSDPLYMGVSTYEVRVNRKVIATFEHRRGDPLEVCLMKASKAVAKAKWVPKQPAEAGGGEVMCPRFDHDPPLMRKNHPELNTSRLK